jgi:hypothetical protein
MENILKFSVLVDNKDCDSLKGEWGFDAVGRDTSEELVRLAKERLGIPVFTADMSCVNI